MLSCAAPAAAAPHARAPWPLHQHHVLHQTIKEEPTDACAESAESAYSKEAASSAYYSSGFHSASPSSSSKDSHGSRTASPRSEHAASPGCEPRALLQLQLRPGGAYAPLTPPGRLSPRYSPELRAPAHSTPLPPAGTPPSSPPARDGYFGRAGYAASGVEAELGDRASRAAAAPCDETDLRDGSDGEYDEEPGLRVPAVNSHGKVKTFKCKQCEFVAVTKLSFWEHTKEHIKPEKMLTCPKCPFVTEYKHHLEYHMRNHFGSKPFQCTQCSYSCVNKSMLNSHLKSHSNVYQYRCADCNYATKYCHSLKLHLRKYRHNPAMVLNHDGTPNPLPIIDVYGTRRGPKTKPPPKPEERVPRQPPAPHPLFHNPFAVNFPYGSLIPHPFLFPHNNNYGDKPSEPEPAPPLPGSLLQQRLSFPESAAAAAEPRYLALSPPRASPPRTTPPPPAVSSTPTPPPSVPDDALDLTHGKSAESGSPPHCRPQDGAEPLTPTAIKSRRKGRAFKLQPAALRLQHAEPRPREAPPSDSDSDEPRSAPRAASTASASPPRAPPAALYDCSFCDISFKDLTMHTIHMGYHGYNDPFMCNKCGERSADKISFFIHLGRAEHA